MTATTGLPLAEALLRPMPQENAATHQKKKKKKNHL